MSQKHTQGLELLTGPVLNKGTDFTPVEDEKFWVTS